MTTKIEFLKHPIYISIFAALILQPFLSPNVASAQTCPDFNTVIAPTYELPGSNPQTNEKYNDIQPTSQSYKVTIPETGNSVDFDIKVSMKTNVFTKIYTNLLSLVPFVATTPNYVVNYEYASQPEIVAKWNKYYCIDGFNEVRTGNTTVNMTGTFIDEKEDREPRPCRADEIFDGKTNCYDTVYTPVSVNADQSPSGDTQVPNYTGPYEIAKKLAWSLKDQYCRVNDREAACINDNFFCDETKPPGNDPSGRGMTGTCVFNKPNADRNANVMCTDVVTSLKDMQPQMLSSQICADGGYTLRAAKPDELPRIQTGGVAEDGGKNSLPFNISLFADNGETTNQDCITGGENCYADGYFRGVSAKLSQLSYDDLKRVERIPARFEAEYDTDGDVKDGNGPWISDYVEKLGGVDYMAEDIRSLNPSLLKSGYSTMVEGGHIVYNRLGNGGVVHVGNIPLGLRPDSAGNDITGIQYAPVVSKQVRGDDYVVITPIAVASETFVPYFTLSEGSKTPPPLKSIPGGGITRQYPYKAFLNTQGDAIFLALKDGAYRYITYSGIDNKNFSNWQEISSRFNSIARFAIDADDNIHIIGTDVEDTNVLNYGKYSFKDASRGLVLVNETAITFPRAIRSYRASAFSIQTDNEGMAQIIVGVASSNTAKDWYDNDLYYVTVSPAGAVGPLELAVSIAEDYRSGYIMGQAETTPDILNNHELSMFGSSIIAHNGNVIVVYLNNNYGFNRDISQNFGHAFQVSYAIRKPDGTWKQNFKLSDRVVGDYAFFKEVNLSRYGELAFTLIDKANKYDENYKNFDGAGGKMCLFINWNNFVQRAMLGEETLNCGYSGAGIKHVISPSSTAGGGNMQFIDFGKLPPR